jgi:hypothetical protein
MVSIIYSRMTLAHELWSDSFIGVFIPPSPNIGMSHCDHLTVGV